MHFSLARINCFIIANQSNHVCIVLHTSVYLYDTHTMIQSTDNKLNHSLSLTHTHNY